MTTVKFNKGPKHGIIAQVDLSRGNTLNVAVAPKVNYLRANAYPEAYADMTYKTIMYEIKFVTVDWGLGPKRIPCTDTNGRIIMELVK